MSSLIFKSIICIFYLDGGGRGGGGGGGAEIGNNRFFNL